MKEDRVERLPIPSVTALICTRNRGDQITTTIRSLLSSSHSQFELIVIDQSTNEETAQAIQPFLADPRLRYIRSHTKGLGLARNLGLAESRADYVAMTDDDCEAPSDWLETMEAVFRENPKVAVIFCNVDTPPYDHSQGFIPMYVQKRNLRITGKTGLLRWHGIGAGMGVRRSAMEAMGGFDEMLGAGAYFPSYEDGDIANRALLKGYEVYHTSRTTVIHYGFRDWDAGRNLTRRDWIAIGAGHAKLLRCGHPAALLVMLRFGWFSFLSPTLTSLARLRVPAVLRRLKNYWVGFYHGLRTPVDCETLCFRDGTGEVQGLKRARMNSVLLFSLILSSQKLLNYICSDLLNAFV